MASSRTALSGKSSPAAPKIITENDRNAFDQTIHRQVSERAYSLYDAAGRQDGNSDQHWFQAESETLLQNLDVRESGSWMSVNAALPDVSAENIEIFLESHRVIVRVQKREGLQGESGKGSGSALQDLFLSKILPAEIEPSTASASFKDQKLTVMVKKRYPEGTKETPSTRTSI
jgi:HSP20 family molecular chaperone IbpA